MDSRNWTQKGEKTWVYKWEERNLNLALIGNIVWSAIFVAFLSELYPNILNNLCLWYSYKSVFHLSSPLHFLTQQKNMEDILFQHGLYFSVSCTQCMPLFILIWSELEWQLFILMWRVLESPKLQRRKKWPPFYKTMCTNLLLGYDV